MSLGTELHGLDWVETVHSSPSCEACGHETETVDRKHQKKKWVSLLAQEKKKKELKLTVSDIPSKSDNSTVTQHQNRLSTYDFVEERTIVDKYNSSRLLNKGLENGRSSPGIDETEDVNNKSVKTVPKLILKRVSGKTNYYHIENSNLKKKKKRRHSKRKYLYTQPALNENEMCGSFETVWLSENEEVMLLSDSETNNNLVEFETHVEDEMVTFMNCPSQMFSSQEVTPTGSVTELAETLYLIISAQRDRLKRVLKAQNLSPEFILKEKTLAEEEFEDLKKKWGTHFTEHFGILEDHLRCKYGNLSAVYAHILYELFHSFQNIDITNQATVEEVNNLVISILKENNHITEVFHYDNVNEHYF